MNIFKSFNSDNNSNLKESFKYVKNQIDSNQKHWNSRNLSRKIRISDRINIPRDTFKDNIKLKITKDSEVYAENYGRVEEYGKEKITLRSVGLLVIILGEQLTITCYTEDELIIRGRIKNIEYIRIH
jgi:sporulation protein YqfC